MVKYKCNDCGKTFKGDYSTKACPECKSENISEVTSLFANKTNRILLGVIIAVAVLTIVALCIFMKPSTIEAVLTDDETSVIVTVTGVHVDDLEELYQVQVYTEEGESKEVLFFDGEHNYVTYNKSYLLAGRLYSFALEKIGGGTIPNLVYDNKEYRCEGITDTDTLDFGPEIVEITSGKVNIKTRKYDDIQILVKNEGDFTYSIGDKEQKSNVFNNVASGDYVVRVSDADGHVSEKPLFLPEIPAGKVNPLQISEVQSIIDNVSNGKISAGDAAKMLARGSVKLANPVDEYQTLAQVLNDAAIFETKFVVVRFECDELGKIKSGSLEIRLKK